MSVQTTATAGATRPIRATYRAPFGRFLIRAWLNLFSLALFILGVVMLGLTLFAAGGHIADVAETGDDAAVGAAIFGSAIGMLIATTASIALMVAAAMIELLLLIEQHVYEAARRAPR